MISDQFEHLNMFSFWGNIKNGVPHSHITLSQNVNILVKTKKAPKALKRKINLNFFCDMGVPILGERGGEGSAHLGIFPT